MTDYIYTFHMAAFMFLSGYVFNIAYAKGKYSILEFTRRRLDRLIVPLLFAKFILWNPVNLAIGNYDLNECGKILTELGHLWYLAVLFALSLLAYIFVKIPFPLFQRSSLVKKL